MTKNTALKLATLGGIGVTAAGAGLAGGPLLAVIAAAGAVLTAIPAVFHDAPKRAKRDARGQVADDEAPQ